MLYDTTRLSLLQVNKGYTALVADALAFLGFVEYQTFTAQQAIELLAQLGLNSKQVRIGLNHPIFGRNRTRSATYTLPAASTARKVAGGDSDNALKTPLPRSAFSSLKMYRMHILKAFLERKPGKHYRKFLAEMIGVVGGTIYNYVKALGIKVQKNVRSHILTPEWMSKLPSYKWQGRFWLQIFTKETVIDAPLRQEIALKWLSRGFKVAIAEQIENTYGEQSYTSGIYADFIES